MLIKKQRPAVQRVVVDCAFVAIAKPQRSLLDGLGRRRVGGSYGHGSMYRVCGGSA